MPKRDEEVYATSPSGEQLACRLAPDERESPGWRPVADGPLMILVGLTGAGKSTTVEALAALGLPFVTLPNRRVLTDHFIIAPMQEEEGREGEEVGRIERLRYTRLFRERFPGGMAHILSKLCVQCTDGSVLLVFDGLRGRNEVLFGASKLPNARFLLVDLADDERVRRLVKRADPFDAIRLGHDGLVARKERYSVRNLRDLGIPDASSLFTTDQEAALLSMLRYGDVAESELRDAVRIVVEERRNYDSKAALAALMELAPERTLVVDTARRTPPEVAHAALSRLFQGFGVGESVPSAIESRATREGSARPCP